MKKIIDFFKKDTVLSIAVLLAVISSFLVKPSKEYISYIDYRALRYQILNRYNRV